MIRLSTCFCNQLLAQGTLQDLGVGVLGELRLEHHAGRNFRSSDITGQVLTDLVLGGIRSWLQLHDGTDLFAIDDIRKANDGGLGNGWMEEKRLFRSEEHTSELQSHSFISYAV